MIQTILLFTLRPGVTDEQIEALRAGLAAIPFEGRHNMRLGRDIGLLDGGGHGRHKRICDTTGTAARPDFRCLSLVG